jgi:hypothetical protein
LHDALNFDVLIAFISETRNKSIDAIIRELNQHAAVHDDDDDESEQPLLTVVESFADYGSTIHYQTIL